MASSVNLFHHCVSSYILGSAVLNLFLLIELLLLFMEFHDRGWGSSVHALNPLIIVFDTWEFLYVPSSMYYWYSRLVVAYGVSEGGVEWSGIWGWGVKYVIALVGFRLNLNQLYEDFSVFSSIHTIAHHIRGSSISAAFP